MALKRVLLQLDVDPLPSSFDAIVALDSGVDHLLPYGSVTPERAVPLVHGAIFTRAAGDLHQTAIFIGGSRLDDAEAVWRAVHDAFCGPLRVSVMLDPNGANTTASAAVLRVAQHVDLKGADCLVLGGTGPVGRRVARLLAAQGAFVRLASRSLERARAAWEAVLERVPEACGEPCVSEPPDQLPLDQVTVVVNAGAAGVQLLPASCWKSRAQLKVLVDLNAVPPAGIEGVEPADKGTERNGVVCYGALGVGSLKMKIHRAAIQKLFEGKDFDLDAEQIFELGREIARA